MTKRRRSDFVVFYYKKRTRNNKTRVKDVVSFWTSEPCGEQYQKMGRFVEGKMGSLSVDGWSGITRERVVGVAVIVERRTFLASIENTEGRRHTAGLLTDCLQTPLPPSIPLQRPLLTL